MNKFTSLIERIAYTNPNLFVNEIQGIAHLSWYERCYILADSLKTTNDVDVAPLIARHLIQEFTEIYIGVIKQKILDIKFCERKADLIRTLKGFNCTSIVFELVNVLSSENYEQAFAAYTVLANADFELTNDLKLIIKKQVAEINHLAFCVNKKQIRIAIEDIFENMQI